MTKDNPSGALDVKGAVAAARRVLTDLLKTEGIQDVTLEEVSRTDDEEFWDITLSYTVPSIQERILALPFPLQKGVPREYKTIRLNASSGDFVHMKIRELQR